MGDETEAMIEAEGLAKHYRQTRALAGVDFTVRAGTILGLLGPNGAGKTTAVRILTTLALPDTGRATVAGIDVVSIPARCGATSASPPRKRRSTRCSPGARTW
ncbi:MAG TPA: ATP-binding cassette domain-containing protein [Mycobacterium sp.]|jgi:ABC-type multidrug transport system ATPase subunit|nr:ATP-binding cassette domain-containing protein [Mycobacterium sp.]